MKNLRNPEGLLNEAAQVLVHRAFPVCLVVGLVSFDRSCKNSGASEPFQLSLDGTRTEASHTDDLALVKAFVRVRKERSEHDLPRRAE